MTEEEFMQAVANKAGSLKITTPFLLFSIMSLAENSAAREADVLKPYFKWVTDDSHDKAVKQKRSRVQERKEQAIAALADMDTSLTTVAASGLFGAASFGALMGEDKPLRLHYTAWEQLISDRQQLWQLASKANYNAERDAVQIMHALAPELVEEAKAFLPAFKQNKLTFD